MRLKECLDASLPLPLDYEIDYVLSGCFINLNLVIKVVITHRKRCCAHDQTGAAGARMISFNG